MQLNSHLSLISLPSSQRHSTESLVDARLEEVKNTPLFLAHVQDLLDKSSSVHAAQSSTGSQEDSPSESKEFFAQRGLVGLRLEIFGSGDENGSEDPCADSHDQTESSHTGEGLGTIGSSNDSPEVDSALDSSLEKDLVYANLTAPWSTFICGSQGSGKSHTLSCLLENALISPSQTGTLNHPMTALVFHYDKFVGYYGSQVCEAAYLCSAGIPVRVLVSPSNLHAMQNLYALPQLSPSVKRPKVMPMYFSPEQLNIGMMKTLMSVTDGSGGVPLYMEVTITLPISTPKMVRKYVIYGGKQLLNHSRWS
jgi:hypothetical protein